MHILQHFSKLTSSKVKLNWTDVEQNSFYNIKKIVAHNNLSSYPTFNQQFYIHMDSNGFQLGAVVIQEGKGIYFHIRNLIGY